MNLIIDVGNTRTKYAIFNNNCETYSESSAEPSLEVITRLKSQYPGIVKAIISSTGHVSAGFIGEVRNSFKIFMEFSQHTRVPFFSRYKTPETIGLDRLAAMAGASNLYPGKNVLVIDAGSAITYDLKSNTNEHIGGNISPGLSMRFKALNQFTHKLPLVEPDIDITLLGDSTRQAILNGVVNGIIYEIDGTIERIERNYEDLTIILTGGDAPFFDNMLKKAIFVVPNLVNIGLNSILEFNAGS